MHNVVILHVQNKAVTKDAYMASINYSTSIQEPTLSSAEVTAFIRYKMKDSSRSEY
jgi:hypothetical protein